MVGLLRNWSQPMQSSRSMALSWQPQPAQVPDRSPPTSCAAIVSIGTNVRACGLVARGGLQLNRCPRALDGACHDAASRAPSACVDLRSRQTAGVGNIADVCSIAMLSRRVRADLAYLCSTLRGSLGHGV